MMAVTWFLLGLQGRCRFAYTYLKRQQHQQRVGFFPPYSRSLSLRSLRREGEVCMGIVRRERRSCSLIISASDLSGPASSWGLSPFPSTIPVFSQWNFLYRKVARKRTLSPSLPFSLCFIPPCSLHLYTSFEYVLHI